MKKILLFLMLSVSIGAKAQNVAEPGKPYDYYCEVALEHISGKFNRCRINLFAETNSNIPVLIDDAGERTIPAMARMLSSTAISWNI